ncbi:MAG TPA: hypothetical protein VHU14_09170 [Solirubrobacterales bacterium]|jgi:hypothetical protein|nr:hypothetical protein [Solirubrobacterales bacterium]
MGQEDLGWLLPDGMAERIERFDPRPGGGFRMELTYLDPAGSAGKISGSRDVTEVEGGTEVSVRADDVPPGISASDHEVGIGILQMDEQRCRVRLVGVCPR